MYMYVYICIKLNHFAVHQKVTQCCKSIIHQFTKKVMRKVHFFPFRYLTENLLCAKHYTKGYMLVLVDSCPPGTDNILKKHRSNLLHWEERGNHEFSENTGQGHLNHLTKIQKGPSLNTGTEFGKRDARRQKLNCGR